MRHVLTGYTAAFVVLGSTLVGMGMEEPGTVSLFDGKSLSGWVPEHTDRFTVRDGVIVDQGGTGWLRSAKAYKNFELRAEFRILQKGAESGLVFRAGSESTPKEPFWPAKGYQLQVVDAEGNLKIFGHGTTPPRFERNTAALQKAMKGLNEWQKLVLRVTGTRVAAMLNGVEITTSDAIQLPSGYLGLLGKSGHFEWRELKIRELPEK